MYAQRAALGLIATLTSGCLIGFDSNRLAGGRDAGTGGAAGASVPDAGADLGPSICDELSPYAPGVPLTNWVEGSGTWRVVVMAQGKVLIQTDNSMSRDDRFVAWRVGADVADATVSAVALLGGSTTDLNCVLVRVVDVADYYALCVQDVGGRNQPSMRQWTLLSVVGGTETQLDGAVIPAAASHLLSLRAQGTTLTATVDGDVKTVIDDSALTHGSVGVSTDDGGGFFNLCTGLQ
jgi:hypothetical protein